MKRLFVAFVAIPLFIGCTSGVKYSEGDFLALGAYLPFDGALYGVEICQKMNGVTVSCRSNQWMQIERDYSCTNSFFGIITTRETSRTKVQIR